MTAVLAAQVDRPDERAVLLEVRRDGVAIVTIDEPREPQSILAPAFRTQLGAAIGRIEGDASIAAAVLVTGRAEGFLAGMNLRLLKAVKFAADAERMASELARTLRRLAALRKPVVASISASAMGGAFEIALACHSIVASDDAVVGLPAVQSGLVPAANGLLRVCARLGLRGAVDIALSGAPIPAERARSLGLIDDVCSRAIVFDVAVRQAKAMVGHLPRAADAPAGLVARALERNPVSRRILFSRARERARLQTRAPSSAPRLAVDVLERLATHGFDAAADLEAKSFGELVVSETAHRLTELASAARALDRDPGVDDGAEPRPVQHAAVVGGGTIGAGVAYLTVRAGVQVRLKERDDRAAGLALRSVQAALGDLVADRRITQVDAEQTFARLSSTTDFSGLRNADLVFEALPEDLGLKRALLRDVEALVRPRCVFASCTSSIPIAKIAHVATHPDRVVGTRYFRPVAGAPLVEVIRADCTASWAVATAVALAKRQGKAVIVVRDGPGFYATRILAPLLHEAAQLVAEGVAVDAIDAAVVEWGFPVGPLQVLDEMGIDVAARVARGLHSAFGSRMTPPGSFAKLLADERRGSANGRGFYRHDPNASSARPGVDASVYGVLNVTPKTRLPPEEIQMRCALAMVGEAVRCLGDGVLRSARDGDVGAVFGVGFPAFRGGPFRYVDTIGPAEVLRRVQSYADRFGERWAPAPLLVQLAKKGDRFFS